VASGSLAAYEPDAVAIYARMADCLDPPRCMIVVSSKHAMTFWATREFWQIRPQNKSVFNRQSAPERYLLPISLVLRE
jgi:hypothetical protein